MTLSMPFMAIWLNSICLEEKYYDYELYKRSWTIACNACDIPWNKVHDLQHHRSIGSTEMASVQTICVQYMFDILESRGNIHHTPDYRLYMAGNIRLNHGSA